MDHARATSPLFSDLYASVREPARLDDIPTTDKRLLMGAFDEWSTDRAVTLEAATRFASRDETVGDLFLGRYLYSESSGTSGQRGRFVTEDSALTVLHALRSRLPRPTPTAVARMIAKRGRSVSILNTYGHHLGVAYHRRVNGDSRPGREILSVADPLDDIAARVAGIDPASISSFSSVLTLLAEEQLAGTIDLSPVVVMPFSETVTDTTRRRLGQAWPRSTVVERYVANECMFISARCPKGSHHLNADWVILEAVDADRRPVPPGVDSHSVLLTTLFRRVQPIIRYDLGDRVRFHTDPCGCGSRLPAFDIVGRTGDLLSFPTPAGMRSVSPSVAAIIVDAVDGVAECQLVVDSDERVTVSLVVHHDADEETTQAAVRAQVSETFARAGIRVGVSTVSAPPVRGPGGKLQRVIDRRPMTS